MANWQIYVIAISEHHVVESALGYFINPLITILLAVVFLRERLRKLQWAAVAMGAIAVTVLTIDYGRLPWIALALAGSFGIYGLAKSKLGGKVAAVNSYALESGILLPVAAIQGSIIGAISPGLQFGANGFWGAAGLIFFIGLMVARIVRDLIVTSLRTLDFDKWANRGGVDTMTGNTAISMGNVTMWDAKGAMTRVDKTWGYVRGADGKLRIVLHHSSLPYQAS